MADVLDWEHEDELSRINDFFVETEKSYMAQHWGVRGGAGNPGFSNEVPSQQLLGALTVRIDKSAVRDYDYVGLVDADVRKGDLITLFIGTSKHRLTVTGVSPHGSYKQLELSNG